jgi:stage V sporulation protein S
MEENSSEIIFRVSKETDTKKLASAIYSNLKNVNSLVLSCIGVPSVNQGIKAIITARSISVSNGFDIASYPHFSEVTISNEEKTSISIVLKKENI